MASKKSPQFVSYVGTSDVRLIRSQDWEANDIAQGDVQWDASNDWKVDASSLSAGALEFCKNDVLDFVVEGEPQAEEPATDETALEV